MGNTIEEPAAAWFMRLVLEDMDSPGKFMFLPLLRLLPNQAEQQDKFNIITVTTNINLNLTLSIFIFCFSDL